MNEVYAFLETLDITKDEVLVVAVSYGPDSMFLLDMLKNKYNNNKIVCAHVHHNHRKESDEEARKLEKYCKDNNIIFEFMKIENYNNDKFTEEEARCKRYNFFKRLIEKYSSKYLFTAHHGDDLSETILMRLVRGSNLNGYKGISLISNRDNYSIIRPLLFLTKNQIENACREKNIPYAVDNSNLSDEYTRNRFRNNILKFLKDENKDVHKKFLQFSKELESYDDYIIDVVKKVYNNVENNNELDINLLNKEHSLIRRKVIELYLFNNYNDDVKLITNNIVESILDMLDSDKPNITISMPLSKTLVKSYNRIYFDKVHDYNNYRYELKESVNLPDGIISVVDEIDNSSNYMTKLDSNEITLPIIIRNRKNGDKIEILGSGTKKIKDILIDSKIDRYKRNIYPIVTDSKDNILWLPGLKKSKYDKSKGGKYDIILKYDRKENKNAK